MVASTSRVSNSCRQCASHRAARSWGMASSFGGPARIAPRRRAGEHPPTQGKHAAMLDNPPLLRIHRGHARPDPALVERFRGAQTSHLVDAMDGRGAMDWQIKPMDPATAAFVGPALTAFAYPADVVGVFGALGEAQPGDVVVVANDGYRATAVVGDIVIGLMRNKGVAAFVTDGLARDRAGIVATGLPTF